MIHRFLHCSTTGTGINHRAFYSSVTVKIKTVLFQKLRMSTQTFRAWRTEVFAYFVIFTTNVNTLLFILCSFSFLLWWSSASVINLNQCNNLYLYGLTVFCMRYINIGYLSRSCTSSSWDISSFPFASWFTSSKIILKFKYSVYFQL